MTAGWTERTRRPFVGVAVLSLTAGMWAGLARLGWVAARPIDWVTVGHGPLMALGGIGTLIAVERAVALGRPWGYLSPGISVIATVALITGASARVAAILFTLSGMVLVAIFAAIHHVQPALHTKVLAAGAVARVIGTAVWASGRTVRDLVPWLALFLIATIAGERLELSRLVRTTVRARAMFFAALGILGAGTVTSVWAPEAGVRIAGAGMVALAAWLARYDIARRTVRMRGVTRFIAIALLSGYVWLAAGGIMWIVGALAPGAWYDAGLHSIFLGFVMSLVFGHAPVIVPAVLRTPLRYRPSFAVHLALLHASLAVRISGDLVGNVTARRWGGLLNVLAILLFFGNTIAARTRAPRDAT